MSYTSQFKTTEKDLINLITADMELLAGWLDDTLKPSICTLIIKNGLMEFMKDVLEFQNKNGVTDKSKERVDNLQKLIDAADALDKIATHNNTMQLIIKKQHQDKYILSEKIKELNKQIININQTI